MNIGLMIAGTSAIAALAMAGLWQYEQTKVASLTGKLTTLTAKFDHQQAEMDKLDQALIEANQSIATQQLLAKQNALQMENYSRKLQVSELANAHLNREINELRTKEMQNARNNPYARGNAAAARWADIMQRITGPTSPASQSSNNPNTATNNDSAGSGSTATH